MKYYDLIKVKNQLGLIKEKLKDVILTSSPTSDELNALGLQEYILLEIDRFLIVYDRIKNVIEENYFNDGDLYDYQDYIKGSLGVDGQFPFTLPTSLSDHLKNYLYSFSFIQISVETELKKINKLILSSSSGEDFSQDELFEQRKKEITLLGDRIKTYTENYSKFRETLISLCKEEKFGKLLDMIFN